MKKALLFIYSLIATATLIGCGGNISDEDSPEQLKPTEGGRYYGGVFSLSEPDYIKSLFPPSIVDIYSYRVASQIYEGLFKFDQSTLDVIPSLASSYEVDDEGLVYTIQLRDDVYFHDDDCFEGGKGRPLKAQDVLYCFERLCTPHPNNQSFYLFDGIVKGARSMYDKAKNNEADLSLEGVEVVDDYTLKVTLEKPSSLFLYNLCRPGTFIYPKWHPNTREQPCYKQGIYDVCSPRESSCISSRSKLLNKLV